MASLTFFLFLDNGDNVFQSRVCDHKFHSECICDWLERRSNTECPCCRQPLVSESDIWEAVKMGRKLKKKQAKLSKRKEHGLPPSSKAAGESEYPPDDTGDRIERHLAGHRGQETTTTAGNPSQGEGQSVHSPVHADRNVQNGTAGIDFDVEIQISGNTQTPLSNIAANNPPCEPEEISSGRRCELSEI